MAKAAACAWDTEPSAKPAMKAPISPGVRTSPSRLRAMTSCGRKLMAEVLRRMGGEWQGFGAFGPKVDSLTMEPRLCAYFGRADDVDRHARVVKVSAMEGPEGRW